MEERTSRTTFFAAATFQHSASRQAGGGLKVKADRPWWQPLGCTFDHVALRREAWSAPLDQMEHAGRELIALPPVPAEAPEPSLGPVTLDSDPDGQCFQDPSPGSSAARFVNSSAAAGAAHRSCAARPRLLLRLVEHYRVQFGDLVVLGPSMFSPTVSLRRGPSL